MPNCTKNDCEPDSLASRVRELYAVTGGSLSCGWMCDEVARFMSALVSFWKPDLVIQTGHLWGKSAAAVLDGFIPYSPMEKADNGDQKFRDFVAAGTPVAAKTRLISVDPKPMDVPHPTLGVLYLQAEFPGWLDFRRCTSVEFFRDFAPEPHERRIMGIVDGDHTDAGCLGDLTGLSRLGAGLIVVDDTTWLPSLAGVAMRFAAEHGYERARFNEYNGITVLTRG